MALKLRRGTDSQRALITPADGELIYTTDTKKLFVGDGTTQGGNPVDTAGAALGSNLSLNNFDLVGTGNINTTGNITVTGNITADGNLTLGGNLTVGDASSDTLNLTAKVESHILPDVDSARNVGSATLRWNQGYFGSLHITDTLDAGSVNANIIGDDSTVYYVHKFHNRGCSVSSDAGSSFKFFGMSVLAEGTDEGQADSGFVNVDTQ